MPVYGVDVHPRFQRGLDFNVLRQQGYGYAAVKLTQGTSFLAANARTWVGQAGAAQLIPGAYHWLEAGNGAKQAEWFFDNIPGGPAGKLIQLDCEANASYSDCTAWRDRWYQLSGGHPFELYTGAWWWAVRGWNGKAISPYLWDSHYLGADADTVADNPITFANRVPAAWWHPGYGQWDEASMIQFTSKGDAGTLGNNVDLDVFAGSRTQLLALTVAPGRAPINTGSGEDDDMAVDDIRAWTLETVLGMRQLLADQGVELDAADLEKIRNAASEGVLAAGPALIDQMVARVKDGLPAGQVSGLTAADVEAAVRAAFAGGLAPSEQGKPTP